MGTDRRGNPITSCLVNPEDELPSQQSTSPGRKAKCKPENLLSLLPADSVNDWQKKAKSEFDVGRSQFFEHKGTLERNQSFVVDPVTRRIAAN